MIVYVHGVLCYAWAVMDNAIKGRALEISPDFTVWVRPLAETDADELIELFEHMGPESRYNRFHTVLTHPTDEFVRRWATLLANVPPERGAAWLIIANLPNEPDAVIGGGRYVFVGEDGGKTAEVSLVVRDDMQRRGIGTKMLGFLAGEARTSGVERLTANILSANPGAIAIIKRLPFPAVFSPSGGEYDVEIDLRQLAERFPADGFPRKR